MPSVNTFITALVAGFAIGAHAGPCRPHASSSVIQYPVSTTQQTAAGTSAAYTYVVSKSDAKTSLSTTAVQVTSSTKDESEPAAKTTPTAKEDATSAPYTSTSVPETTSKPKTTLETTTVAPTTTSKPTTTTSEAYTTTSAAATSSCPPSSELTCAKTGFFSNADSNLIQVYYDYNLSQCQEECEKTDNCKTIGITTSNQCELYDAAVSALGFEFRDGWYYSVYDACCFKT
ncbi:uncharacterized protein FFB20_08880 [Fusarium fujikuroi]|uniref:Apple domain-containing protein n=2 Tax=Fusarium fujikuroi TaxID=5127 RepID=S0DSY7_GIBF5|nr:uncharacterized protein FFUJ_02485 [Fusarium fujikuroi IMI 58289]KLP08227.1 uncharacterized protein Y057_11772 [Fusarium fujikuroi]KLP14882.1 uncharacterized protein LW94_5043 [Fusarium fujikuroi]QGI61695.1 hypothetical protein CEK27_005666 [Fusarium fujikuroi]QGI78883.1 hypothetical protein CEK25_005612 [Fusarium fujikuroi]QGI92594.1 hypothetical protein CEK26_005663 [Fusarium fujikuroi]